jgi:hypothetical protein
VDDVSIARHVADLLRTPLAEPSCGAAHIVSDWFERNVENHLTGTCGFDGNLNVRIEEHNLLTRQSEAEA